MKPGYYLVTPDGERRFISARVNPAALDRMCDQYLTESTGWNYWIDRCMGLKIDGRPAWVNHDQSDRFYDAMMRADAGYVKVTLKHDVMAAIARATGGK